MPQAKSQHAHPHALIARHFRLEVLQIRVAWLHGICVFEDPRNRAVEACVSWGGVIAQAMLLVLAVFTLFVIQQLGFKLPAVLAPVFFVLLPINCVTIVIN